MARAGGLLTPSLPPESSRTCWAAPPLLFRGAGGGQRCLIPRPKIPTSKQRCPLKHRALSSIHCKAQAQKNGRRQEVGAKPGSAGHSPLHPLPAPCQGPAAALRALLGGCGHCPPHTVPFSSQIHRDCLPSFLSHTHSSNAPQTTVFPGSCKYYEVS